MISCRLVLCGSSVYVQKKRSVASFESVVDASIRSLILSLPLMLDSDRVSVAVLTEEDIFDQKHTNQIRLSTFNYFQARCQNWEAKVKSRRCPTIVLALQGTKLCCSRISALLLVFLSGVHKRISKHGRALNIGVGRKYYRGYEQNASSMTDERWEWRTLLGPQS